MKRILILLFCLPIGIQLWAQDDDIDLPEADPNMKKYLDDGLRQDAFGNIQVAVTSFLPGWFDVSYEQKLNRMLSAEAGIGLRMFNGIDAIDLMNDLGTSYFSRDVSMAGGFGYVAGLRYYPLRAGITQYGYYGVDYRGRSTKFNYDDDPKNSLTISSQDFIFSTGRKKIYNNNISLAVVTGVGARIYTTKYTEKGFDDEKSGGFIYLLQLKLGYYL